MTLKGEDAETPISFRVDDDLLADFEELCDREGVSRSDALRELMRREVEAASDDERIGPDDPVLNAAYEQLVEEAGRPIDGGGLRMTMDDAKELLYSNDIPKERVRRRLIKPLRKKDWVRIDTTIGTVWVVVRPPERGEP